MSGQDRAVFFNTGKSATVRQFVYGLIAIICLEYIIAGVIIYFVVPAGWPLLLAVTLLFCLLLFVAYGFAGILRSAHLVSGDLLSLRMGRWFSCRLPLALIAAVERHSLSSLPKPDMLGITCTRAGEILYCLSRPGDVCRIQLTEPVMVKAPAAEDRRNKRGLVREILINVDEPEKFLQRMSGVAAAQEEPHTDVVRAAGEDQGSILEQEAGGGISEKALQNETLFETQTAGLLPGLQFEKLTRYYGDFPAVQDLTLKAYPGEIFGFLGANGAGKTTTIRMITGLLRPTAGRVLVRGEDLWQPGADKRRSIGYVPDTPLVYERLTAREHLFVAGRLYNLPQERLKERVEALLSMFSLESWGDQLISTYSMGMRRKFSLALALLPAPELLIIDELTNAFDAPTLAQIKDILIELRSRGKTVFISTHVMDVAEKVCDRVGIIHQGQLKALGTVEALCRSYRVEGGLEPLFLKIVTGKGVEQ